MTYCRKFAARGGPNPTWLRRTPKITNKEHASPWASSLLFLHCAVRENIREEPHNWSLPAVEPTHHVARCSVAYNSCGSRDEILLVRRVSLLDKARLLYLCCFESLSAKFLKGARTKRPFLPTRLWTTLLGSTSVYDYVSLNSEPCQTIQYFLLYIEEIFSMIVWELWYNG